MENRINRLFPDRPKAINQFPSHGIGSRKHGMAFLVLAVLVFHLAMSGCAENPAQESSNAQETEPAMSAKIEGETPILSDRVKVMEHFAKVTSKNEFFASGKVVFPFFTIGTLEWPHLKQWGGKELLVHGTNKAGTNYHAVFLVRGAERTPVCVAVFAEEKDGEWKPRERNGENW